MIDGHDDDRTPVEYPVRPKTARHLKDRLSVVERRLNILFWASMILFAVAGLLLFRK